MTYTEIKNRVLQIRAEKQRYTKDFGPYFAKTSYQNSMAALRKRLDKLAGRPDQEARKALENKLHQAATIHNLNISDIQITDDHATATVNNHPEFKEIYTSIIDQTRMTTSRHADSYTKAYAIQHDSKRKNLKTK